MGVLSFGGISHGGGGGVSWQLYDGTADVATASVSTAKNNTNYADACVLSSTRGVIVVGNTNNSSYGTAYLINLATGAVLSTLVFKSVAITGLRCCKIDSQYFAVVYTTATTTEGGWIINTASDTLATVGSEQSLTGLVLTGNAFDIDFIDTNKLICGYQDASNADGYVATLSCNTGTGAITVGTPTAIITTVTLSAEDFRIRATSTTSFVCAGGDGSSVLIGAGTISGTSVTRVTSGSGGSTSSTPRICNIAANPTFTDFVFCVSGDNEASPYVTYNGSTFTNQSLLCVAPRRDAGFFDIATFNSVRYGLSIEFESDTELNIRGAKLDATNKCVVFESAGVDIGNPENTGLLRPASVTVETISDTSALIIFTEDSTNNLKLHIANL